MNENNSIPPLPEWLHDHTPAPHPVGCRCEWCADDTISSCDYDPTFIDLVKSYPWFVARTVALAVAGGLILWALLWMLVPQGADAAEPVQRAPYGGCAEVLQDFPAYLHTEGADWCRDHGWTIRRHLVVGPHGVVRYNTMTPCDWEDDTSGP